MVNLLCKLRLHSWFYRKAEILDVGSSHGTFRNIRTCRRCRKMQFFMYYRGTGQEAWHPIPKNVKLVDEAFKEIEN